MCLYYNPFCLFLETKCACSCVCVDCVFSLCLFVYLGSMCESVTFFSLQR